MEFQKGNDYWKIAIENGTIGKNKKYTPSELSEKINEWVEITKHSFWEKEDFIKSGPEAGQIIKMKTSTPFLIQDLCLYLRVNRNYFTDLFDSLQGKNDPESLEYSRVIAHVEQLIATQKLQGGLVGAYNPMLVARIEGLKEKTDITSNDQQISCITVSKEEAKRISEQIEKDL
jgi:hypothetical protein